MAWAFWRTPVEGKHALGPAVTAIPSRPVAPPPVPYRAVPAAAPVAVAAPPVPTATVVAVPVVPAPVVRTPPPPPAPLPQTPDELYDEIARMLLSGDAFADPSAADPEQVLSALPPSARAVVLHRVQQLSGRTHAAPVPVAIPVIAVPAQTAVRQEPLAAAVPQARTDAATAPSSAETPAPSARDALAELAASLAAAEAASDTTDGPRVELTFRDGTSAALDPSSDSGLALQQLALSLTRRD